MRTLALSILCCSLLCGLLPSLHAAPDEMVSLDSLLTEMVQREGLARFPEPAYTCGQFSSYDRDMVPDRAETWYANWDRSQFVRTEKNQGRTEHVLMDVSGPGAVVRFWATWHGPGGGPFSNGTLRIYLDGQAEPVVAGPTEDVIDKGFLVGPPLSASVSPQTKYAQRGHNLYFPIPYARHCKITYETKVLIDRGARKGEALYYQINYRTYAPGTQVKSFSMAQIKSLKGKIDLVQKRLMRSGVDLVGAEETVALSGTVAPGKSVSKSSGGSGAVKRLTVKLKAEDKEQALRSTILSITFDGKETVWCPVGDFFGVGNRYNAYKTWYTLAEKDGTLSCFWVMPYKKKFTWTLINLGDQPVTVEKGRATLCAWDWDDRSLYFHAAWKQLTRVKTGPNKDMSGKGAFDVNYVTVQGRGQYVGDTLTIFNGTDAWWGEGDEKIYIDGETFPSHIGTGTEDYYGYAWCKPAYFTMPFHAQPDGSGNFLVGHSVNSRYRALDAIPFTKSIKMDMELWHWRKTQMNFAPASFWYADAASQANVKHDPKTAALPVARVVDDVVEVVRVKGAIEGEGFKVVKKTGGDAEVQATSQFGWSGNKQIWWKHGKTGDVLTLEFISPKGGTCRVKANLTKAVDYGIVQIAINGKAAGKPLDRYHTAVETDLISLGECELAAGKNRMTVTITGCHPKAVKKYMFGLDYLLIE